MQALTPLVRASLSVSGSLSSTLGSVVDDAPAEQSSSRGHRNRCRRRLPRCPLEFWHYRVGRKRLGVGGGVQDGRDLDVRGENVFDDGVLLERVDGHVGPIARVVHAAVRHLRSDLAMVIEPDRAERQCTRDAVTAPHIA